jgi:hypothetical protein
LAVLKVRKYLKPISAVKTVLKLTFLATKRINKFFFYWLISREMLVNCPFFGILRVQKGKNPVC